jgi:hypothetical protein
MMSIPFVVAPAHLLKTGGTVDVSGSPRTRTGNALAGLPVTHGVAGLIGETIV